MNEVESEAMWRLYAGADHSIAIQSTFEKLRNALPSKIECGVIRYVNFEEETIAEDNALGPFMVKRKSFEHEQELRAITMDEWPMKNSAFDHSARPSDAGSTVGVNLNDLIENIYVSPLAQDWYLEAVKSTVEKYGLQKEVSRSSLDKDPFF